MALIDLRQLMAGVLTFSMFVMLMNMVKTDYFDIPQNDLSGGEIHEVETSSLHETELLVLSKWHMNGSTLKPCWTKPPHHKLDQEERDLGNSKGYIIFSLTGGHEHHLSEVSNAIVVARSLGAILVLPDVITKRSGDSRKFDEFYDVSKFITAIEGIVKVTTTQPLGVSTKHLTLVRIPSRVSEEYITSNVQPIYKEKGSLKIVTYLSTSPMTKGEGNDTTAVSCLTIFEVLQLKVDLKKIIHSMVERLRSFGKNSTSLYIAVDLEDEILEKKECDVNLDDGRKSCYSAYAIGQFLKKIGIEREANIYLTSNGWHDSLNSLTEIYPNVHRKDTLITDEKIAPLLSLETSVYKNIIDYYICSWSDIYIPAKFDHFYASVVGKRIMTGEKVVLELAESESDKGSTYISPSMSRKSHYAYSCLC